MLMIFRFDFAIHGTRPHSALQCILLAQQSLFSQQQELHEPWEEGLGSAALPFTSVGRFWKESSTFSRWAAEVPGFQIGLKVWD